MGEKAEVYDAEMRGLVEGALAAIPLAMRSQPEAHTIVFCADNQAAIDTILQTTGHPGQLHSTLFCQAVNEYLEANPRARVNLRWTPGHKGIRGNELADRAAKEATLREGDVPVPATYVYMRRHAKEEALHGWKEQWQRSKREDQVRRGNLYSAANRFEPSLQPQEHFRAITNRMVYGLVLQCRTGHAFMGEYYQRFVPTEPVGCPCGIALQTRQHILLHCPRYDAHRYLLRHDHRLMTVADIVGTREGIAALSKFIVATGAFTKTGDARVPSTVDSVYVKRPRRRAPNDDPSP